MFESREKIEIPIFTFLGNNKSSIKIMVLQRQLSWLVLVMVMANNRIPKAVLYSELKNKSRLPLDLKMMNKIFIK